MDEPASPRGRACVWADGGSGTPAAEPVSSSVWPPQSQLRSGMIGETMSEAYVHGYHWRESERLRDQAGTLVELMHSDTAYPSGSTVLEVGCGVGAQTVTLARRSPDARFTSIDVQPESIAEARQRVDDAGLTNVECREADIFALPWGPESFDHVFVCFVLELYPDSARARAAIQCQVTLQAQAGGNSLIGRELCPLMTAAGLDRVRVSPRTVYVDSSRADLVDGFTRKTFTAMIEGIREPALAAGLIDPVSSDTGLCDLRRTAEQDGVFCYTFFKGVGAKSRHA